MPGVVLDSFALLTFPSGEPGYEKVLMALEKAADTDSNLMIAAPNWAEVRYIVERKVVFRNGFGSERGCWVYL